jgi:hypothetical protein
LAHEEAADKATWDAIRAVRAANAQPVRRSSRPEIAAGTLDASALETVLGHPAPLKDGVAKMTVGREGTMDGTTIGASMGLTTWAAFSGSDAGAAVDGDFIMTAAEVQPILHALRKGGLDITALHNHMIGEEPAFFFTHFWGKGPARDLAAAVRGALDAQAAAGKAPGMHR